MAEEQGTKELSQVTTPAASPGLMLESFDLADDSKLLAALSKRVTKTFTYKVNGKHGLSSAGALWASREFAKQGEVYRVEGDVKIEACPLEPADFINVMVKVARYFVHPGTGQEIKLDTTIGHKRMGRKTKRYKDDAGTEFEMVDDPEFTTKAITKAERNGKLKLMPKDAILNLITKAIAMDTGASSTPKQTTPPKGNTAKPATPPAEPKKDEAKKAEEPKKEEAKKAEESKKDAAASAPAQPPKENPPAAPADGKPKMTREVMIQKLDAVCKMVFNTQDGTVARAELAKLTGKASPSDLSDEEIKKIGNAINAVAKKTASIDKNNIVRTSDKAVLWKGPEVKPPPAEAPAAPGQEEEMF